MKNGEKQRTKKNKPAHHTNTRTSVTLKKKLFNVLELFLPKRNIYIYHNFLFHCITANTITLYSTGRFF